MDDIDANLNLLSSTKQGDIGGIRAAIADGACNYIQAIKESIDFRQNQVTIYLIQCSNFSQQDIQTIFDFAISNANYDIFKYILEIYYIENYKNISKRKKRKHSKQEKNHFKIDGKILKYSFLKSLFPKGRSSKESVKERLMIINDFIDLGFNLDPSLDSYNESSFYRFYNSVLEKLMNTNSIQISKFLIKKGISLNHVSNEIKRNFFLKNQEYVDEIKNIKEQNEVRQILKSFKRKRK